MVESESDIVRAFMAAIHRRNSQEISDLMAEGHLFMDSGGRAESGRQAMT